MADGKGPKSPDELSKAVEEAFKQPVTPKEALPTAAAAEVVEQPNKVAHPKKTEAATEEAIQATQAAIQKTTKETLEAVVAPVEDVAQRAHRVLTEHFGTTKDEGIVRRLVELPNLAQKGDETNLAREEHHKIDPQDLKGESEQGSEQ